MIIPYQIDDARKAVVPHIEDAEIIGCETEDDAMNLIDEEVYRHFQKHVTPCYNSASVRSSVQAIRNTPGGEREVA